MAEEYHSSCWYSTACPEVKDRCTVTCIKYLEMKCLMDNSGIPIAKQKTITLIPQDCDYDAFCRLADIKDDIESFVAQGKNLYLGSNVTGNGKTSWAIKLMLRFFDRVWAGNGFKPRGLFIHTPTLLLQLKNFDNPLTDEYKNLILNCDLVIWDDIGAGNISNYDYGNLLMYLDNRILCEKSNIFTSNITNQNTLADKLGVKIASRVWDTSEKIILNGGTRRDGSITNIK